MSERVLIIGGAGFVGSHTADALFTKGYTLDRSTLLDDFTGRLFFSYTCCRTKAP
jgi:nucleoside-diphosphate-sugar epimerase